MLLLWWWCSSCAYGTANSLDKTSIIFLYLYFYNLLFDLLIIQHWSCAANVTLRITMCRGSVDWRQHRQLESPTDQHSDAAHVEPGWTDIQRCRRWRVLPKPRSRASDEMVSGLIDQVHYVSDITWSVRVHLSVAANPRLVFVWLVAQKDS